MYTVLTIVHVFVCIFLMLVVLLQAGRGGGIGLAFGGSGGSQSVFGSSGGANFLTKMTAFCAVVFFANSMALAYLSSQSDSRRLQQIAEKKAQAQKEADAASKKALLDIDKARDEKAKAEAAKSEGTPAEGTAGEEKTAPATDDKAPAVEQKPAGDKAAAPDLKLKLPGADGQAGKLAPELKLEQADKKAAEKKAAEKKAERPAKAEKKKAAPADGTSDESPASEDKPAKKSRKKAAAETTEDKPAAEEKPAAE